MAQDGAPNASRSETEGRAGTPGERPLVAFDFDGTLTVRDSFTAFLEWYAKPVRYALGGAALAPAALRYLIDRDRGRIKAAAARQYLGGLAMARVEMLARDFAGLHAPALLRPDALGAWREWRAKGAYVLIVTASPTAVVAPFAKLLGADELIGTEFAVDATGRLTGAFATPNCRGPEKVARLRARFGPKVRLAAAYGDTAGDREMLQIADVPGYRVFTQRPGGA